ncbi:MAG: hypothetical protein KF770_22340 [Anaerolineae bacterium]|nr:hypothetical protein [Anaerolineae bacterium]
MAWYFAPIPGQVLLVPDNWQQISAWPQVRLENEILRPGERATTVIFDTVPWAYVKLLAGTAEGTLESHTTDRATAVTQWNWSFTVPDEPGYTLAFYHDCHTGCQHWTTVNVGKTPPAAPPSAAIPTKLGVVLADPDRNWHNRAGWDVEITYAQLAEEEFWGIDDLAQRVEAAAAKGLRVLVRVDFGQGQSIPPVDDYRALELYLRYLRRLARDDRLQRVYGYIIGSSFNTAANNSQSPGQPVTPGWYARVFNGYNAPPANTDNALQTIRAENQTARVLVGPVAPWNVDQDGALPFPQAAPWLNYFYALVTAVNQSAQDKSQYGIALNAPDGFAVQAPGYPDAPELADLARAGEPRLNLPHPEWPAAQAGFRVYQEWLEIINAQPHTRGTPVYVTATHTYHPGSNREPAENYAPGWLTSALDVVNEEPQIAALCWFLDVFPHDDQWDFFSLAEGHGLLGEAAKEFDMLLQDVPES